MKKGLTSIKSGLTIFARAVVLLVGLAAVAICVILLPELAREESVGKPFNPFVLYGFFAAAYAIAIPFFIALYQTHKLLNYIDNGKAFSEKTIQALQTIKMSAVVFSIMVVIATSAAIAIAKIVDPSEDVTFIVPLGLVLTFVPVVIAVFVAVFQKLIFDAMEMKSENDLIV